MDEVLENDNVELTIAFYDPDGTLEVPTSATYRIDDVPSGTEVRDDTALAASSSQTITLKYADTAILDTSNPHERRRLTAVAQYGTDTDGNPIQKTFEYDYQVLNARFKP